MAGTHIVAFNGVFRIRHGQQRLIHLAHLDRIEQQPAALVRADCIGLAPPQKLHTFLLGVLIFKVECRHVALTTAIKQVHRLRAQPTRRIGGINRSIACSDNDNRAAQFAEAPGFVRRDEFEGVKNAFLILAGNIHTLHGTKSHAEEDEVELRLQLFQRFSGFDRGAGAELRAHAPNHLGFAQAVRGAQLVLCHSIGVEAAKQVFPFKNGGRRAMSAKLRCAGQRCRTAANTCNLYIARSARCGQ